MKKKLICFGDSITAGWDGSRERPALTRRLEKGLKWLIRNAGVPGETTEQALTRIDKDVLSRNYNRVTILFGANDSSLHKGISLEKFMDNMTIMAKSCGSGRTILITPSPVIEERQKGKRTNGRISIYAEAVRRVAAETGSALVDLQRRMLEKADYRPMLQADGLHFSSAGYDFLSGLIIHEIEKGGND
ncbi:GDSL-type esterase/lipase family protein [Sporolactobacillus sp. CQH2019]|uniref:GDSL-type esterase/lipase family protein n=1 Tax=Sporolactobacillus sp. CQH2019 TaxID=3023512 RepID=UPI002368BEA3|nr:GDSL-type esterase/lipase family protein [Sporolactobacillus sp. CQH2019]MDD9149448.1 GDSL-type esterase/lipase family protein [Sporolactobacillus sp. CQH2019]